MHLRIAENIRRLRQESHLTQVQLAERLGVSYQAVSRWENETTYPDIELLPAIAALFGVTVDHLLGSNTEAQQASRQRGWDKLRSITDPRERVAHLRQMHRAFPDDWYLFVRLCAEEPSRDERYRLTEELLATCPVPFARERAIRNMIRTEDEDKVVDYMAKQNIFEEQWDVLLEDRYRSRGEADKYRKKKQELLRCHINAVFGRLTESGTCELDPDPAEGDKGARTVLAMIAAMTGTGLTSEHPVAGDGGIDLWFSERAWAGISIACALSAEGDTAAAMTVLEDAADLIRRVRALPADTPLSYHTHGLDYFDTTRAKLGGVHYHHDHMTEQFAHRGFDALRQDERYTERFEAARRVFVEE